MIIFNEESNDIVEEKHICYYTEFNSDNIILKEVIEKKIKHPDAKELAYVYKIDVRFIHEFKRNELKASSVILLEAAQNAVSLINNNVDNDY
jgi:hypothetical protein